MPPQNGGAKTPRIVARYKRSLKNPWAEEIVDLLLFRPLALIFVELFYPLPVAPNHISLMAMVAGAAAGYWYSTGDPRGFALGSAAYLLSNTLDCADGMIARLKGSGTNTGRIVDGMVDYAVGAAVYIGFGIGLAKTGYRALPGIQCSAWIIMVVAAASTAVQTMATDRYSRFFLALESGTSTSPEKEIVTFNGELRRLNTESGHALYKLFIGLYMVYSRLQVGALSARSKKPERKPTRFMMALWNLIGPSTHVTVFAVAAILYKPSVFLVYTIAAANVWLVFLLGLKTLTGLRAEKRTGGHGVSVG